MALTRITGSAFGLRPMRLLILKPPSMLMLLNEPTICWTRLAFAERHQQPFIGYVLAVGILHRRDRISRPLMRQAGAIKIDNVGISLGPDSLVEKARPFGGIDALVAVGGGEPGALMRNQETCAVALPTTSYPIMSTISSAMRSRLKIPRGEAWAAACRRAQPLVQQIALPDRSDYRGIGTREFHCG